MMLYICIHDGALSLQQELGHALHVLWLCPTDLKLGQNHPAILSRLLITITDTCMYVCTYMYICITWISISFQCTIKAALESTKCPVNSGTNYLTINSLAELLRLGNSLYCQIEQIVTQSVIIGREYFQLFASYGEWFCLKLCPN